MPYTGSSDAVVQQGQKGVQRGYEPEVQPVDTDIQNYAVVAIGTPAWWYTMALSVRTFLYQQDWYSKTIVPFQTHGGWPGHVLKDLAAACSGAKAVCGMQVQFDSYGGDHLETFKAKVKAWAQKVKALL